VHITTTSATDIGAALFVFRYSGVAPREPVLAEAASGLVVHSATHNGQLRILVSPDLNRPSKVSAGTHELLTIPFAGNGTIELTDVQMSDALGALLSASAAKDYVPTDYSLLQNYPNPFNSGTVISFDLREPTDWTLSVYNVMGQQVRTFSGHDGPARISLPWDGTDPSGRPLASGVYFYRVHTGSFTATRKMTLVK